MTDAPLLFTPDGYRDLLCAARDGGYRLVHFDPDGPINGALYLRHDVDKRVSWAREMAELEAELDVRSTYFFLLHTPLYSVLETAVHADIQRIRDLGHEIALHCDERRMVHATGDLDADVEAELELLGRLVGPVAPVVSFHNPTDRVIGRAPAGRYVSTYAPDWFPPGFAYLSDSNQRFREGDPRPDLRAHRWPSLQLLVHPIWHGGRGRDALDVLGRCVEARTADLTTYLDDSNHVWANRRRAESPDAAPPGRARRESATLRGVPADPNYGEP